MCQIHLYQHPCGHEIRSGLSWVCHVAITASLDRRPDDPIPECNTINWVRDTNIPPGRECRVCTEGLTVEEASQAEGGVATPDTREEQNGNGTSRGGAAPASTSASGRRQTRRGSGRGSGGSGRGSGRGQNMPNGASSGSGEDENNRSNRRT